LTHYNINKMAENVNNTIKTTVELDVTDAQVEIVKLNAVASDSTEDLEKRLKAKNKQIEIQNRLNKQTQSDLKKQIKTLKGVQGKEKELERAIKKLNKARVNEAKVNTRNEKVQKKLAAAYKTSKSAMGALDKATGGFITRLRVLAANPVIAIITALGLALKLLQAAFTSSEKGQNAWNKALGVANAILGNLLDVVAEAAEALYEMVKKPKESIKDFGEFLKKNITNRFDGLLELIPQLGKAITLLFEGKFSEAGTVAANAVAKVGLGIDDVVGKTQKAIDKIEEYIEHQVEEGKAAGKVADMRAKADLIERALLVERSLLEAGIAELRLKSREEEKYGAKERKQFLLDAQKLEDTLIDKEVEYLTLRKDAQVLENTFSRSNKENLNKEAEARAAVNKALTNRYNIARQVQREVTRVEGQIEAERKRLIREEELRLKRISDFKKSLIDVDADNRLLELDAEKKERDAAYALLVADDATKNELLLANERKYQEDKKKLAAEIEYERREFGLEVAEYDLERLRLDGEATLAKELEFLNQSRQFEVDAAGLTGEEINFINKQYADKEQDLRELAKQQEHDKWVSILGSGISALGEAFGFSKEAAVATALIDMYSGIMDVWGSKSETGLVGAGLAQKIATTGIVATTGYNTIKKILATDGPAGYSGSSGGGAVAAPVVPTANTADITDLTSRTEAGSGFDFDLSSSATSNAANNFGALSNLNIVFSEAAYTQFQNQISFTNNLSSI
jgi:hypothetical protein